MKRLIILVAIVLLLSGCVKVGGSPYIAVIDEAITSKENIYNTYRKGYKFYLPRGLYVDDSCDFNETIKNGREIYYLYIDLLSYLNQVPNQYEENNSAFYSKYFENDGKFGYIEINKQNDKYLVEIMYNYAKIEVMVEENNLESSVANAIIVLSSIYYNDGILKNMSMENILSYSEDDVDIFSTKGKDNSNFLKYVEEYDADMNEEVPDYDKIR